MAIAFTSWAACDWQGGYSLQWQYERMRNRLVFIYLEALRQALIERSTAVSIATPALLATEPLPHSVTWANAFDDHLRATIVAYTDHTKYGGNYHDVPQSNWPVTWTVQDILTQTGYDELISLDTATPYDARWPLQRYAILNELRWITKTGQSSLLTNTVVESRAVPGTPPTYNAAKALWPGTAWGVSGTGLPLYTGDSNISVGAYFLNKKANTYTYTNPGASDVRFDLYGRLGNPTASASFYVFSDPVYNLSEVNSYALLSGVTVPAASGVTTSAISRGDEHALSEVARGGKIGWEMLAVSRVEKSEPFVFVSPLIALESSTPSSSSNTAALGTSSGETLSSTSGSVSASSSSTAADDTSSTSDGTSSTYSSQSFSSSSSSSSASSLST